MIGPRVGLVAGPRSGYATGIGEDELTPSGGGGGIAGVSRDASSGVYCPASAAEWTLLMAAAGLATGNPSALYLCQEAAANLADSIGTFTLAASGTGLVYQQAIAGWARKAFGTTSGGTGVAASVDIGLPNILTNSILLLGYVQPTTIATTRDIMGAGAAATKILASNLLTSGFARELCVANSASGAADTGGVVRPWALGINRTAASTALYTNAEKIVPAFGATAAGQSITLGTLVAGCATARYLYLAAFFNAAAELTSAQVKTLLTTLGWAGIPWS